MTKTELKDLIKKGETTTVQFKSTFKTAEDVANELVAFSNSRGGLLIIGVEDKTGDALGLSYKEIQRIGSMIGNAANDRMHPGIYPEVDTYDLDGKIVMTVKVEPGMCKPYKNFRGEIYVKQGPDKRRVTDNQEILRLFYESGTYHPDRMGVEGTGIEDIDKVRLDEFFKQYYHLSLSELDMPLEKALKNLDLIDHEGRLTMAGLMFFGKTPRFKYEWFMIKAVCFYGDSIGEETYRDSRDIIGTLPYMFEKGMDFLDSMLHHIQGNQNFNSVGILEIPEVALREILQNALVHRSWMAPAPIRLLIFSDRVEIISPGALPNNLTVDEIKMGNAYQRNQLAATLCAKTMEYRGLGSGIVRALRADSNIEFHNEVNGDQFRVILWRKNSKSLVPTLEEPLPQYQKTPLAGFELQKKKKTARERILECISQDGKVTTAILASRLEMSVSGIERNLRILKQEGRLRRVGPDKGGRWEVISG